jgi:hypothetical protein
MTSHSKHGVGCGCAQHASPPPRSLWATLAPAVSCAACPTCMALWKPLLALLGVTFVFTETEHAWLLLGSLVVALGVGLWDVRRSGVWGPFWLTVAGSAFMAAAHLPGDIDALEWTGLGLLASSMLLRWVPKARLPVTSHD